MSASDEVDNAFGAAPAKVDVIELLAEKRAALSVAREKYQSAKAARDEQQMGDQSRLIDALKELIPILETEAAGALEATGRKEAEERLLGIRRAYGSTVATYGEDEKRVQQAVAALGEAIKTLNGRAKKLEALRAEAAGLADRFDLTAPILTIVSESREDIASSLPPFWRLRAQRPSFEQCEHNIRTRRDYAELSGSPAYDVIGRTGLKPFRPLTQQEKEILEDKADERKPDPVLAAAATEAHALGALRVPGGHVARG